MAPALALACGLLAPAGAAAQGPGTEDGQWAYLGGDAWHTRYTPADQLDPSNFEQIEVAWQWNATSFGPATARATPSLVGGKLITVAGNRRHVVALDPATGEVLWSFREPNTYRYEYSMRKGYGKGHLLRRDRRPRGRVHHVSGLLPARPRRRHRPAP